MQGVKESDFQNLKLLSAKVKVKVKLSLCLLLAEHHAMKAYWGRGIAPRIIGLGTTWW